MINIKKFKIKDLLLLKPKIYKDDRGFFESYNKKNIKN